MFDFSARIEGAEVLLGDIFYIFHLKLGYIQQSKNPYILGGRKS